MIFAGVYRNLDPPLQRRHRIQNESNRQPAELSAETLLNRIYLLLEWRAQLKAIGID